MVIHFIIGLDKWPMGLDYGLSDGMGLVLVYLWHIIDIYFVIRNSNLKYDIVHCTLYSVHCKKYRKYT